MTIIDEPNGHFIRAACCVCRAGFELTHPQAALWTRCRERLGDVCPDCLEAATAAGLHGLVERMTPEGEWLPPWFMDESELRIVRIDAAAECMWL